MRTLIQLATALVFAWPAFADDRPGTASLDLSSATAGDPAQVTIWYPASSGGASVQVGGNAVFIGADAMRDAEAAEGTWPLILLSHGGLRSASNSGAWLASALAMRGFLVAEINPAPLDMRDPASVLEVMWRRPAGISAALDALLDHPDWGPRIDTDAIAVVGFYLGGTAALMLAGERLEPDAHARACLMGAGEDCAWFAARGIDPASADPAKLSADRSDRRIATAVAIEPELVPVLQPRDRDLATRAAIVALGSAPPPSRTGIDSIRVANASHFDGFAACTLRGAAILAADGGERAICKELPDRARAGIHADLAATIQAILSE